MVLPGRCIQAKATLELCICGKMALPLAHYYYEQMTHMVPTAPYPKRRQQTWSADLPRNDLQEISDPSP